MKNIQLFKHIAAGLLLSGSLIGTSCSSDYMDTIPTENVSFTTVSTSLDNLYLALNGIHRKMVSQDLGNQGLGGEPGFIIGREALADDLTWDTQTWHQGFLNWSYPTNATSSYNSGEWETYYKFILNANNILKALNDNFSDESKLTDSEKALANHIKGECLAIRAWSHFNLVQYYAKPYIVANVPPNCFMPRPNVGSAVIRLMRHTEPKIVVKDEKFMFKLIRASFNQRRKTLQNGINNSAELSISKDAVVEALRKMGLSESIRGEALTLAQFAELSDLLCE